MKQSDNDLIRELKQIFDEQLSDKRHKVQDLPAEIHGHLADLLFIDKVENDALVNFIIGLIYTHNGEEDPKVLSPLKDIQATLDKMSPDPKGYVNGKDFDDQQILDDLEAQVRKLQPKSLSTVEALQHGENVSREHIQLLIDGLEEDLATYLRSGSFTEQQRKETQRLAGVLGCLKRI